MALGVACTKYTELESIVEFMFGTVFELGIDATRIVVSKIGFEAASQLMAKRLSQLEWPAKFKDAVGHFITAVNICNGNRNHLMHSEMMFTDLDNTIIPFKPTAKTVLFKTTKAGKVVATALTITELRAVADDINTYCEYGRLLGNAINNMSSDPPTFPVSVFPWPDKPALPRSLEYKSDPIPL